MGIEQMSRGRNNKMFTVVASGVERVVDSMSFLYYPHCLYLFCSEGSRGSPTCLLCFRISLLVKHASLTAPPCPFQTEAHADSGLGFLGQYWSSHRRPHPEILFPFFILGAHSLLLQGKYKLLGVAHKAPRGACSLLT